MQPSYCSRSYCCPLLPLLVLPLLLLPHLPIPSAPVLSVAILISKVPYCCGASLPLGAPHCGILLGS